MSEKFCFPLGKTAAENITVFREALKDETTGKSQVCIWCHCFKRGDMSGENHSHSVHPSVSGPDRNVAKVCQAVLANHHWTIDKISEITGLSWSSC